MKHCLVKDGNIVKYNVIKPKVIVGSEDGIYLPLEDNAPALDVTTHRISGSTYEVQTDKVVKIYTVVEITPEELQVKAIQEATTYVDGLIAKEISDYNEANGTKFVDVNSLAKFVLVTTYEHYDFCLSMINWVAILWETARNSTATTKEDFVAELPTRV